MSFAAEHLAGRPERIREIFEAGGVALGSKRGAEHVALCPFHEDTKPSLSVRLDSGVYLCRACEAKGDAVEFHRLRNSFARPEDAIADLRKRLGIGSPAATAPTVPRTMAFEIRDPAGALVAVHERRELSDGSKGFSWKRDGKSGLAGLPVADLPLYRSEMIAASDAEAPIILTEGEKAADALAAAGFVAVGTVTGASAVPAAGPLEVLRGRDVVLWPDNDEPGGRHMTRLDEALQGVAASVGWVRWGSEKGDDAADFFERGGTPDQLDGILSDAEPLCGNEPTKDDTAAQVPEGWLTPGEVLKSVPRPKHRFPTGFPSLDTASRGGFPTGALVVLAGWPDAGKTGLGTQIAIKVAVEAEVVVVMFTPDGGREATAIRIGGLLGLDQDKLEGREPKEMERLSERLRDRRVFIVDDSLDGMVFERIREDAEKYRPDLPHVYLLDSAQECLATEKADELDERNRVVALMREAYRMVDANPIPSLVILTSQVSGQAFAAKKRDRTAPIGAPAESKKISFLSHMIVSLEGDPSKEPEFGRAEVVKSKLRGPKPTFGLRVDTQTSRLAEIDAFAVEDARARRELKEREANSSQAQEKILAALDVCKPRPGDPGIASRRVSEKARLNRGRAPFMDAIDALEAQGMIESVEGPRNGTYFRRRTP